MDAMNVKNIFLFFMSSIFERTLNLHPLGSFTVGIQLEQCIAVKITELLSYSSF